jgi:hypothetical protein
MRNNLPGVERKDENGKNLPNLTEDDIANFIA